MRILLINQTFYPDVAATAQHAHDLATHLTQQGHEVTVVASRSIYGQRGASLPRHETVEGVEVYRVGASLFGKGPLLLRCIDFALFYILATLRSLTLPRADVVLCLTTPPMIGLLGSVLKRFKKSAFVYWIMDLYPDVLVECGFMPARSLRSRMLEKLNNHCVRRSDRTVVLGRCMTQRLLSKGLPEEKLACIRVWSDVQELAESAEQTEQLRQEWNLRGKFVVMYSGNFGLGHDIQTMCEAARQLQHRDDIRFVFVGGGKRKKAVEAFLAQHQLTNAISKPFQPRSRLGGLLTLGDVHLASLIDPLAGAIVPSKTFGIMAAGRPALFIGPKDSEAGQVLQEHDCGCVIPVGDAHCLSAEIQRLADDPQRARQMGESGRAAVTDYYDRRHACEAWELLLQEVVDSPVPATIA